MISHNHKCLFVHIPKCAGQSVELAFLNDLGLTWRNRAPLLLREKMPGEKAPPVLAHLTAREYLKNNYISNELFFDYYKISVTRHPVDRAVSLYNYLNVKSEFVDFLNNLQDIVEKKKGRYWFLKPQIEYLKDNDNKICMNKIVDIKELPHAWNEISEHLAMRSKDLPYRNHTEQKKINVSDVSSYARQKIKEIYREDFLALGYE